MNRILLVAAVPQELQAFRPLAAGRVECLITGMGERAGQVVRDRLRRERFDLVVSTGFAGGLQPGFKVGDLVAASEVVEEASGFRRPSSWSELGLNGAFPVGSFLTVRKPLLDPQAKSDAGARFGALAADMETAAVASAAYQGGAAWVGFRAILDPMERRLAVGSWREGVGSLLFPSRWKAFMGLMQDLRMASRCLAGGLKELVKGECHGSGKGC